MNDSPFACAALIKEIGRGPNGSRPLSRETADDLYSAMLSGRVSDIELGAILIAYRVKGESPEELAGMLSAAQRHLIPVRTPAASAYRAVSIPSYNGARKQANLTPLLAALLARRGVPVLVQGVRTDAGRVTSAQIFAAMGIPVCATADAATESLATTNIAFLPIDVLSPGLNRLLQLRKVLGVRNSTHTLVKLLNPFQQNDDGDAGIRLVNYTHPPYRDSMMGLFTTFPDLAVGDILLARGTEGEAVADTRRQVQIDWLHNGAAKILVAAARREADQAAPLLPEALDAHATAQWISEALNDESKVPDSILRQVNEIIQIAARPTA